MPPYATGGHAVNDEFSGALKKGIPSRSKILWHRALDPVAYRKHRPKRV